MFNYVVGAQICPDCKAKEEELFQKVKKYIDENKGANITRVAEACEVELAQLQQWVREERLEFSSSVGTGITCEKCGTPIASGRYCVKCKEEMVNVLNSALPQKKAPAKKPTKESPKMRFLQ